MTSFFELDASQVRVRDILNKNFLEIEIYAISNAEPNRNGSSFTIDSMKRGVETFIDKPILGFFNSSNDFESHNGKVGYDKELEQEYWDNSQGEQILGFIRNSDSREIVEKDGLMWIKCTAMIYTQYNYKQVKRLLKDKRKKVSVEVRIKDSEMRNGIEYINDFELTGITILGSKNGIPIKEGIEGAHLSVLDLIDEVRYNNQRQALVFAYSELNDEKEEEKDLAQEDKEAKKALKVNKSKEAMSDTAWGDVDKTALRNRVVEAENFKEIAKDVFLDLREGWENGEVSKLKYPVMEIKDGDELVYNRGALGSAKAYAEKNGEDEVLRKLKAIYEHLDLEFEAEEEYSAEAFCEDYECEPKEEHAGPEEEKKMATEELPNEMLDEHPENHPEEDPSDEDDNDEPECDCEDKKLRAECDELKMKCDELCAKNGELEAKCCEFEEKCCKYEEEICALKEQLCKYEDYDATKLALEEANAKLEEIRVNEQKCYIKEVACKMKLMEEDMAPVIKKCEEHQFAATEDIDKDIAYIIYRKNMAQANIEVSAKFEAPIVEEPIVKLEKTEKKEKMTVNERLKNNLKNN